MSGSLSRLRPRRPQRRTILITLIAVAVALVPIELFYVHPRTDRPTRADAVFVLGGTNEDSRVQLGARLVREGYAPVLVLSRQNTGWSCRMALRQITVPPSQVTCARPAPFTTQGESRYISDLAKQRGWKRLIVVTSDDQASRARIRLRRCWSGSLQVVAVPQPTWQIPYKVAYELAATVKAEVLQRSC